MKRLLCLAIFAIVVVAVAAPNQPASTAIYDRAKAVPHSTPLLSTDELNIDTTFKADFTDTNAARNRWTVENLTSASLYWHKDYHHQYVAGRRVWACNDTIAFPPPAYPNGGYANHTLNYLVSPVLNLSGTTNPVLGFRVSVKAEPPSTYQNYNGWDGGNVWYSTNGGTSWAVLPITAANGWAYNVTNAYSFGVEFNMNPPPGTANPIPEWGDSVGNWHVVTVPLTAAMRTAQFRFRFAFCSDPEFCSTDQHTLYGMMVDSVRLSDGATTILYNDATTNAIPSELTGLWGGTVATTNWIRASENTVGHTRPNCYRCPEGTDNFRSALVSPKIFLPRGSQYYWTYNVWCDFRDAVTPPNTTLEDYYRIEIKDSRPDSGWTYQNHDYNRIGYGGDGWTTYEPGFPFGASANVQMDLTPWAGDTIQLRFVAIGDTDNNNGVGSGLFIDDVIIYSTNQPDHDVAMDRLSVPYPNAVGFLTVPTARVRNLGRQAETDVQVRWRRNGQLFPVITLPLSNTGTTDTTLVLRQGINGNDARGWTPTAAGKYAVEAYATVTGDSNRANDSTNFFIPGLATTDSVLVRPSGVYELGYDSHRLQFAFNFPRGSGPIVKCTPAADSVPGPSWDITGVRVQFNGSDVPTGTTRSASIKIYADNAGAPGTLLRTATISVPRDSTLPNWYTAAITPVVNVTGDFWVFLVRPTQTDTLRVVGHDNNPVYQSGHSWVYNDTALSQAGADAFRLHAIVVSHGTSVKEVASSTLPGTFALYNAYPNPFNPSTEIKFAVPYKSLVKVSVYNMAGQEVTELINREMTAGTYSATLNGTHLASGIYFVKMTASGFNASSKIVLVK